MSSPSRALCSAFWTHLCVRTGNQVAPCCVYKYEVPLPRLTTSDVFNSEFFLAHRREALDQQWNANCGACKNSEAFGGDSARKMLERMHPAAEFPLAVDASKQVTYLELFLGNRCNLKCLTCGPNYSSTWKADTAKLSGREFAGAPEMDTQALVGLVSDLKGLRELKLLGGEPFLSERHVPCLNAVDPRIRENVTLRYHSNATYLPSEEILELWPQFKRVTLILSVDAPDRLNDYLRFPSQWSQVERNVEAFVALTRRIPQLQLAVSMTVSLYNVFAMKAMEDWYERLKQRNRDVEFAHLALNAVRSPVFLSPWHLPDSLKEIALRQSAHVTHVDSLGILNETANTPRNEQLWLNSRKREKALDRIRSVSIHDYLPFWPS